jgi:hypothetical protein
MRARLAAAAAALVLLAGVTACSSDDAPPADAVAVPTTAAPVPTLDQAQLAALVAGASATLKKGVRTFDRCDTNATSGYGFNNCWPKTAAGAKAAGDFAGALRAAGSPAAYAAVIARLDRLAAAGPLVRKACRTGDDQKCDSALMRFRNDAQQVDWELDLL